MSTPTLLEQIMANLDDAVLTAANDMNADNLAKVYRLLKIEKNYRKALDNR